MKRKKIWMYLGSGVLVLVLAAAFYIYKEYNRTHKDTTKLRPDYSVIATEFIKEFEQNQQSANEKYWDKVVSVSGLVRKIEKDVNGFYGITLGDSLSASAIRCTLDSAHNLDAVQLQEGQLARLKGICAGFNEDDLLGSDVLLVRCVVDRK